MIHHVSYPNSNGSIRIISSYDNMKNKFANSNLETDLGIKNREELQTHDVLVKLEKDFMCQTKEDHTDHSYEIWKRK